MSFNGGNSVSDVLTTLDALGRPVLNQVRQGPGASNWDTTQNVYDASGRISFVNLPFVDTAGTIQSAIPCVGYFYDGLGRYTSTSRWDGVHELSETDYTYNLKDVEVSVNPPPTGENAKQRQFEYDAIGRLTSVCELTSLNGSRTCSQQTGRTGYFTQYAYSYDVSHSYNVMTVYQGTQTRTYFYDELGRLKQEINPESGTTNYTYDSVNDGTCVINSNGDLVESQDARGDKPCYGYDPLHRLASVGTQGPDSSITPDRCYLYDSATVNGSSMLNAKGRLAEAYTVAHATGCNASKVTDEGFSYSPRGELSDVWESSPHSSGYYHTQAAYWANGTLNTLSSNLTGVPNQTYRLDGEGRTYSISASSGQNPVTSTTYSTASGGSGASETVTYGSGDYDKFDYYYNTGWMKQITYHVAGQDAVTNMLGWNQNGTLQTSSVTDSLNTTVPQQNCSYYYDDLGRLATIPAGSAVTCLNGTQTVWQQDIGYGNDQFGNITKQGTSSWMPNYQSNNRYVTGGGIGYDANGNLTSDTFNTYSWNVYGNPATVNGNTLVYDALGRMVENTITAGTREYLYGPVGSQPLAQMNGQTPVTVQYPLPMGGLAIYNNSGALTYAHADWLGSGRLVTNSTQSMVNDSAYAPFGEQWAVRNIGFSSFYSFTGQQQWTVSGASAGLDDFMFREYHPVQGRWITPDPAGLAAVDMTNPQTWNRYAYVGNNPLNATDPLGLFVNACLGLNPDQCSWSLGTTTYTNGIETTSFPSSLGSNGIAYCPLCGQSFAGQYGGTFMVVADANGPVWISTYGDNYGEELDSAAAGEEGLGDPGSNLPPGTPQNFIDPFNRAFKAAQKDLKKKKCGNFYGGQGPATMNATQYRFLDLGNPIVGAQTNSPDSVFINSNGPFMTYSPVPGQPGPFGLFWTPSQFGAFILLHELGHQLSPITGFLPDAGNPTLNQSQSKQVISVCF
jgi:RHS repeat-associated protein